MFAILLPFHSAIVLVILHINLDHSLVCHHLADGVNVTNVLIMGQCLGMLKVITMLKLNWSPLLTHRDYSI